MGTLLWNDISTPANISVLICVSAPTSHSQSHLCQIKRNIAPYCSIYRLNVLFYSIKAKNVLVKGWCWHFNDMQHWNISANLSCCMHKYKECLCIVDVLLTVWVAIFKYNAQLQRAWVYLDDTHIFAFFESFKVALKSPMTQQRHFFYLSELNCLLSDQSSLKGI